MRTHGKSREQGRIPTLGTDSDAGSRTGSRAHAPPGPARTTATGLAAVASLFGALLTPAPAAASSPGTADGRSAQRIAAEAQGQLDRLSSVRMRLTTASMTLDIALDKWGNCTGRAETDDRGSMEFVKRGRTVWLKPDDAFWKSQAGGDRGAAVAEYVNGRYIRGTTADPAMRGMEATCDLAGLRQSVAATTGDGRQAGEWKRDGTADYRDRQAISVSREDPRGKTTLLVAAEGRPNPLKVTRTSGSGTETLELGRFQQPVTDRTPPAEDSVDVGTLEKAVNSRESGTGSTRQV